MASGQFNIGTSNGYIAGKVTWSSTVDEANNQSTVTATMYLSRTNTGYTTSGSGTFTVTINGTNRSGSKSFNLTYNSNTQMVTGSVVVPHNEDGSKTITIGWSGSSDTFTVDSGSGSAKLDNIARASGLYGGNSWTAGNSTTFALNVSSSDFTHDIKVEVASGAGYQLIENITGITTANYTWTPDAADMQTIFDYINNDTATWKQETRVTVTTKNGSTIIGSKEYLGGYVSSPNASTTSSSMDFEVGDPVTVAITKGLNKTEIIHTLRFYVGATLIHTSPIGQGVSYTWTPSASEITAMHNAMSTVTSATSKVEIDTFWNATTDQKIKNTTSKTGTARITNANPVFSTFTYKDTNATISAFTGNDQYIVQNKSTLAATILNANKAVAQKGASITKYIMSFDGATLTQNSPFSTDITFTWGLVNASSNQNLTIAAYDSRGNKTEVTKAINIVPWSAPVINTTAARVNGFENGVTLTLKGSISPVRVVTTDKNSLKAANTSYRYRQKGTTPWSAAVLFSGLTLTMPSYTATNASVNGGTGLDNNFAWEIEVTVTDQLGASTTIVTVSAGKPILFIDAVKKALGINKFPSSSGVALDMSGNLWTDESIIAGKGRSIYTSVGVERIVGADTYKAVIGTEVDGSLGLYLYKNGIEVGKTLLGTTGVTTFNKEPIMTTLEEGYCGVGGTSQNTTTSAVAGIGVNFRIKKNYVPSSITMTATSSNRTPNAIDITVDGFWLYINGNGTTGNYAYWRGTYKA